MGAMEEREPERAEELKPTPELSYCLMCYCDPLGEAQHIDLEPEEYDALKEHLVTLRAAPAPALAETLNAAGTPQHRHLSAESRRRMSIAQRRRWREIRRRAA